MRMPTDDTMENTSNSLSARSTAVLASESASSSRWQIVRSLRKASWRFMRIADLKCAVPLRHYHADGISAYEAGEIGLGKAAVMLDVSPGE